MRGLPDSIRPDAWGRAVEWLCYPLAATLWVVAAGVLARAGSGWAPPVAASVLPVALATYLGLSLALALAVSLDARAVRTVGGWRPSPVGYGVGTVLAAPIVVPSYLAFRHANFGTPPDGRSWHRLVSFSLALSLVAAALASAVVIEVGPEWVRPLAWVAGGVVAACLPIALHRDAATVSFRHAGWEPNPGRYLGLASLSVLVPGLGSVLAVYYLSRRGRIIGPSR